MNSAGQGENLCRLLVFEAGCGISDVILTLMDSFKSENRHSREGGSPE